MKWGAQDNVMKKKTELSREEQGDKRNGKLVSTMSSRSARAGKGDAASADVVKKK